ncbi:hypothetical protein E2493_11370 [Sphingomonas parva]|uniref:Uncharacterized protein n=1 Tax=Sphingomonas parva TaxID=2555898 RepID=A0A4Y8ZQ91_9SPHN|nr:hypothetical protein [Sphingomonas parva]TFI58173.1 hypothetical protein E2493_11370 [Sphingomonas parva]
MRRDCTEEAERLFRRVAARHGLRWEAAAEPPIELLWSFPAQPGLSLPITLGLQNMDELNFGVADFWSYFFPFEDVAETFEAMLDAWIAGEARILVTGRRGRILQVRGGGQWETVYRAGRLLPFRGEAQAIIRNRG